MTNVSGQREMEDALMDSVTIAPVNGVIFTDRTFVVLQDDIEEEDE